MVCRGRTLVEGRANAEVVVLDEPLSFWGGLDSATGTIIDQRHPQRGISVRDKILVMPSGRGSSSSSSTIAEAARAETAPAGIVLLEPDLIVTVGLLVAAELYGARRPVVVLAPEEYSSLTSGARAIIDASLDEAVVNVEP